MITASDISIRTIQPGDNAALAALIRDTLTEFGANHPGTVYYDESTDHLYEVFSAASSSVYYVAEYEDRIVGGAGIYPTDGLPPDTCELVKMYLKPEVRGIGLGKLLIEQCIQAARNAGFNRIYLESMPELKKALTVYEKFGFKYLPAPMGNSGHTGCPLWMLKDL